MEILPSAHFVKINLIHYQYISYFLIYSELCLH